MLSRSYASDGTSKWLLFVREESGLLLFTAIVHSESTVVAQLRVDTKALEAHSDELGLEMKPEAFKTILVKALEQRACVDVKVQVDKNTVMDVFLSLTYKFSPVISRKGLFQLPIVAKEIPQSLLELLTSVYMYPPQPVLSEQQKTENETRNAAREAVDKTLREAMQSSHEIADITMASQSSQKKSTPIGPPMLLKRRHIPIGTMYGISTTAGMCSCSLLIGMVAGLVQASKRP